MRRALSALLAFTALIAAAGPVAGAPPVGKCPGPFTTASFADVAAEFPALIDLYGGAANLNAALAVIDANQNQTVCYRPSPPNSSHIIVNVIDDVSRSALQ